jgi:UDP-glucose 4-epimerase
LLVRGEKNPMSFYAERPILVIGGLGFIGVNLTDRLSALGAQVTVVTRSRARHHVRAQAYEARGVRIVEGDLRNQEDMARAVAGQQVIFNLAGESGALRSMEDPRADLDVNCGGNLVLLDSMRRLNPAAKLVFVGSRLEYGRPAKLPVSEDAATEPLCVHAIHKLAVEEYLRLYGRLFGLRFAVARVTNPYGPGQPVGRTAYGVVNWLIHMALADQTLTIYGDGSQQRDYIYVEDVASALLGLGESSASDGRVYNVGTGVGIRLIDMAHTIIRIAGGGRVERVEWPPLAEQIETGDFVADISRAHRELGWAPAVGLQDGLQRTVEFCRAHVAS